MQAGLRNGLAGGALLVRIKCDARQRQAGLRPVRVRQRSSCANPLARPSL